MGSATYEIPNELVIMGEMGIKAFAWFFRLPERLFKRLALAPSNFWKKVLGASSRPREPSTNPAIC